MVMSRITQPRRLFTSFGHLVNMQGYVLNGDNGRPLSQLCWLFPRREVFSAESADPLATRETRLEHAFRKRGDLLSPFMDDLCLV